MPQLLGSRTIIASGASQYLAQELSQHSYSKLFVITDSHIAQHQQPTLPTQLPHHTINLSPGEATKSLNSAEFCWQQLFENGADRQSAVIGFGGGVITDLSGYVAACYMRGIDLITIPTTLLGMVDAAIGGKVGVNLKEGKNIIGCFKQPALTLIDPDLLSTLPDRHFFAGLAEIMKCGIICAPDLFEVLESKEESLLDREASVLDKVIRRAVEIKQELVERDPEDRRGIRATLNYGHTFAHALETLTGYQQLLHGEAVAIGMSCAAHLSVSLGYAMETLVQQTDQLLQQLRLPTVLPKLDLAAMTQLMLRDKKGERGKITCILAEKIGKVFSLSDLTPKQVETGLKRKMEWDERTRSIDCPC